MLHKKEIGILIFILVIAAFLRFYNLLHDSPHFFNPDERNMAIATSRFRLPSQPSQIPICLISQFFPALRNDPGSNSRDNDPGSFATDNCNLNPDFFAYGQFPLYLAYFSDQTVKFVASKILSIVSILQPINNLPAGKAGQQLTISNHLSTPFPSAVFWLRFWSALSSTFTVLLVYFITKELLTTAQRFSRNYTRIPTDNPRKSAILSALICSFTPGLIQSAHFGTTESFLTFFFMASVYLSLKLSKIPNLRNIKKSLFLNSKFIILNSLVLGLAFGTKFTGLFFFVPPFIVFAIQIIKILKRRRKNWVIGLLGYWVIGLFLILGSILFGILSSPYNLVEFQDFKGAVFGYEADVATGKYEAFYTRQFVNTIPILFQMEKIFPYALGWPVFILGILGMLFISFRLILEFLLIIYQKISNIKYQISKLQLKIQNYKNSKASPKETILESELNAKTSDKVMLGYLAQKVGSRRKRRASEKFVSEGMLIIMSCSFLLYFLPNSFLFAKWTRFMTPVFPFFAVFAGYFLFQVLILFRLALHKFQISNFKFQINDKNFKINKFKNFLLGYWVIGLLVFTSLLPGAAFTSIYTHEDSRVQASRWIYQNIPNNSYVLSETANVVDIPVGLKDTSEVAPLNGDSSDGGGSGNKLYNKNFQVISFDFYHTDENPALFQDLFTHLEKANYIFIPSRRIFANYLRLPQRYPLITKYYQLLYSGALGFEKVAEFTSFPSITIPLYPRPYALFFPDEEAEESFTVFDHPVIRIYKKVKPMTKMQYENLFNNLTIEQFNNLSL